MQASIEGFLDGSAPDGDFALEYHIGNSFSGETRLRLRGTGDYEAFSTVTEGRRQLDFQGRLERARVERLVAALRDARVWEARPADRERMLDDPLAAIVVSRGGEEDRVALPASHISAVAPFAAAQAAILELVREVSGGAVLEAGR